MHNGASGATVLLLAPLLSNPMCVCSAKLPLTAFSHVFSGCTCSAMKALQISRHNRAGLLSLKALAREQGGAFARSRTSAVLKTHLSFPQEAGYPTGFCLVSMTLRFEISYQTLCAAQRSRGTHGGKPLGSSWISCHWACILKHALRPTCASALSILIKTC